METSPSATQNKGARRTTATKGSPQTRSAILEAAKRAFGRKGYADTTIADVIAEAGLARGTFYIYFQDKDALFEELFRQVTVEMHHAINAPAKGTYRNRIRESVRAYFELFDEQREILRCFLEITAFKPGLSRFHNDLRAVSLFRIERHITRGIASGLCNPVDPRITSYALGGLLEWMAYQQTAMKFHPWGEPFDQDKLVEQVTDLWCRTVYRGDAADIDPDLVIRRPDDGP